MVERVHLPPGALRQLRRHSLAYASALCLTVSSVGCAAELPGRHEQDDLFVTETATLVAVKGGLGALAFSTLVGAGAVIAAGAVIYIVWSAQKRRRRLTFAHELASAMLFLDIAERVSSVEPREFSRTWEVAAAKLRAGLEKAEGDTRHLQQAMDAPQDQWLIRIAEPPLNPDEVAALGLDRLQQIIADELAPFFHPTWKDLVEERWMAQGMPSREQREVHLRLALADQAGGPAKLDRVQFGKALAYYLGLSIESSSLGRRLEREPETSTDEAGWNGLSDRCRSIQHWELQDIQRLLRRYVAAQSQIATDQINRIPDDLVGTVIDEPLRRLMTRIDQLGNTARFGELFPKTAEKMAKRNSKSLIALRTLKSLLLSPVSEIRDINRQRATELLMVLGLWCHESEQSEFPFEQELETYQHREQLAQQPRRATDYDGDDIRDPLCWEIQDYTLEQLQALVRQYVATQLGIEARHLQQAVRGRSTETQRTLERAEAQLVQLLNDVGASRRFEDLFPGARAQIRVEQHQRLVGPSSIRRMVRQPANLITFRPKERLEWLRMAFAIWCDAKRARGFPHIKGMTK